MKKSISFRFWFGAALIAAALAGSAPAGEIAEPRVVSLNPCLDAILVEVADPRQILALSHYARDPRQSTIAEVAGSFPEIYETAEEIIALHPDLIVESIHSSAPTRAALTRLGIEAAVFDVPTSVEESLDEVRRLASLVGHPDRGEALIARIDAALARAAPPSGVPPVTALVYQRNGLTTGGGTLLDEMLRRTGFDNIAASHYGFTAWGQLPLEFVFADPPEILFSTEDRPGPTSWAERVADHPALRRLEGRMRRVVLPTPLIDCGGPALIRSAAILAAARRSVETSAQ